MSSRVWIRRAYEPPSPVDGHRVLIDRIWPRGVSRDRLHIDTWTRDLAPTDDLRTWFGHDPARWVEFRTGYRRQLDELTGAGAAQLTLLMDRVTHHRVTLVFGARDERHNNAVVLRELLEERRASTQR